MKYSYWRVVAVLSSVSLTSHVHKSSLQIRWIVAANCFLPHGSVKTMQMDGRSPHWVPADCVHAACKCMKHDAGPNRSQPGTGKPNMPRFVEAWICVEGNLGQEVHAKNHSEHICMSYSYRPLECTHLKLTRYSQACAHRDQKKLRDTKWFGFTR